MGVQTSYTANMSAAFEGQCDLALDVVARNQGEASAGMGFGLVVAEDTSVDNDCILLVDANSKPAGITMRSQAYAVPDEYDADADGLQPNTTVNVLRKGHIWVAVEEAVTKGDPFFARHVISGAERKGAIRKSADASDCLDLTAKGRFLTSQATIGELALLDVDFTNT